jgi:hypothetical protein
MKQKNRSRSTKRKDYISRMNDIHEQALHKPETYVMFVIGLATGSYMKNPAMLLGSAVGALGLSTGMTSVTALGIGAGIGSTIRYFRQRAKENARVSPISAPADKPLPENVEISSST